MRKLHWWTGEELEYIRRNWKVMSDRELADHFKVTVVGFVQVRRRLGLKRPMNSAGLQPPIHWNAHKKQQPYWTYDGCKAIRAKQIETLRKRRKVAAYLDFKPYQFAA